jgi:hypothetical protein
MEEAFGTEFGGVRVHTGLEAAALNRALSARAFTTGRDVFFGEQEYAPGGTAGRDLLAHELAHVIQQGCGAARLDPQGSLVVAASDGHLEQDAQAAARSASRAIQAREGDPDARRLRGDLPSEAVDEIRPVRLQRSGGNAAAARILARTNNDHLPGPARRRRGAIAGPAAPPPGPHPSLLETESIENHGGRIHHIMRLQSSTGDLRDLKNQKTREHVWWDAAPSEFGAIPTYTKAGSHVGQQQQNDASVGLVSDQHAIHLFWEGFLYSRRPGRISEVWILSQEYEYESFIDRQWRPIPHATYKIARWFVCDGTKHVAYCRKYATGNDRNCSFLATQELSLDVQARSYIGERTVRPQETQSGVREE